MSYSAHVSDYRASLKVFETLRTNTTNSLKQAKESVMTANGIVDQFVRVQQFLSELIFRAYQFDEQLKAIKREKKYVGGIR